MKSWFYTCIKAGFGWMFRLVFRLKVTGAENIPASSGFILASNHTSDMDPILLIAAFPRKIRFIGKKEIFDTPVIGSIVSWMGGFPIDRGNADMDALDHASGMVEDGDILGIFPEGTRSKTCQMLKVKLGIGIIASKTKADILPICIIGKGVKRPRIFRTTYVNIGPIIKNSDMGFVDDTPRGVRSGVKYISEKMAEIREETIGR